MRQLANDDPVTVRPPARESAVSPVTLLWQRVVLAAMTLATRPIQGLTPRSARRFGNGLGWLAYRVAGRQRRRARANLRLAYGDSLSDAQRDTLARKVFSHYGRCVVDFLRFPRWTPAEMESRVRFEGWEHVAGGLAAGKGVIFVSGHIGNWEMLGRWGATMRNLPMAVVAKDPKNAALAAYLRRMREGAGFRVLSMGTSARDLLKTLRRGEIICLLADQNSGDVFAPFFGVPAGTPQGPAALALHSGAALLPIYCLSDGDGGFVIRCFPRVPAEPTGNRERDTERVTAELNQVLESVVRQYPDQWLWLHNRWKSAFEDGNRVRAWGEDANAESRRAAARARWRE